MSAMLLDIDALLGEEERKYKTTFANATARYFERKRAAGAIQRFWRSAAQSKKDRRAASTARARIGSVGIGAVRLGPPRSAANTQSAPTSTASRSWLSLRTFRRRGSRTQRRDAKWKDEEKDPAQDSDNDSGEYYSYNPALSSTGSSTSSSSSLSSTSASSASSSPRFAAPPRLRMPAHDAAPLHGRSEVMEHNVSAGLSLSAQLQAVVSPNTAASICRPFFTNETSLMSTSPVKRMYSLP